MMRGRRLVGLVLNDKEGLLERSPSGAKLQQLAETHFFELGVHEVPEELRLRTDFVMLLRERSKVDRAFLDALPSLSLILQTGGHAYHIDEPLATSRGVKIVLGRDLAKAPLAAVRELTFGLMLSCLRHIPALSSSMHGEGWPQSTGRLLSGRRLGILGLGRHGKNIAAIGKAFGMEVVAWNRSGRAALDQDGVPLLAWDELLGSSDVLTVHLRLTDESRGLLDAAAFAKTKRGAVLINTARGAIVDERALVEALKSGQLSGAGLDVFDEEPLSSHSELRAMSNVVMTPHIGWQVEEVFYEFAAIAASQLEEHIDQRV
jgi:phosphoglycerate dehydrogenase-like enzyme